MTLLLAAVGAVVTALLELTVGPYLRIGDAQPHLVLVLGVVVTIAVGLEAGLVWAFVGGLALDVLADRPLGSSAFALLLCVGGASVLARSFARLRPIVPIGAVFILSIAYSMILFVDLRRPRAPDPGRRPARHRPARAPIYDAVLAALIGPLAIAVHDRRDGPGAGRLVNTYLDGRPARRPRAPGAFLVFGIVVLLAVSALTARLFYLQIANGHAVRGPVAGEPDRARADHARRAA